MPGLLRTPIFMYVGSDHISVYTVLGSTKRRNQGNRKGEMRKSGNEEIRTALPPEPVGKLYCRSISWLEIKVGSYSEHP